MTTKQILTAEFRAMVRMTAPWFTSSSALSDKLLSQLSYFLWTYRPRPLQTNRVLPSPKVPYYIPKTM